ncbi:MAG: hypothetical protein U9Q22_02530 [Candidatus Altiarchaeota archaeon]|nr:hypothetical protein [Candidatus Altiarchaeota archaeon]
MEKKEGVGGIHTFWKIILSLFFLQILFYLLPEFSKILEVLG